MKNTNARPRSSLQPKLLHKEIFEQRNEVGPKYILFMVGLPARGKSYICKKMSRYLSWCGYTTKVFNVGNRRRLQSDSARQHKSSNFNLEQELSNSPVIPAQPGSTYHAASFFDPFNQDACAVRNQLAMETLEEIMAWLDRGGKVAIHDATNSTVKRRQELLDRVSKEKNIQAVFVGKRFLC